MKKIILVTGSTEGIGLETVKLFASMGHKLLIHGRNAKKLDSIIKSIKDINPNCEVDSFCADFSSLKEVHSMALKIIDRYKKLDILINNAGVFIANNTITADNLELRFQVNTIAPYYLSKLLLPIMGKSSRVINLSSAAQATVNTTYLKKGIKIDDSSAYAQSKLALTMWSIQLGLESLKSVSKPSYIAINPKSFLGSKMVKEAYGREGFDLGIGADILKRAALSNEFSNASGQYYDNDIECFSSPHPDALDEIKRMEIINIMDEILK